VKPEDADAFDQKPVSQHAKKLKRQYQATFADEQ
jgi:hypothetical protein